MEDQGKSKAQEQQKDLPVDENVTAEAWEERTMTDVSFAGFQFWAVIGMMVLGLLGALLGVGGSQVQFMPVAMFVAAAAIGGTILSNKYGKKWGWLFLLAPVLILVSVLVFVPSWTGVDISGVPPQYEPLQKLAAAYAHASGTLPDKQLTLYDLAASEDGQESALGLIDIRLANADFYNAPEQALAAYNGYWYALVAYRQDGKPFADIPGEFAICAFPEEYQLSGKYVYLINHKGELFRRDLGAAMYIKTYPGPDPLDFGWASYQLVEDTEAEARPPGNT